MTHDFIVRQSDGRYIAECCRCGAPWIEPGEYAPCEGEAK